VVAPSAAMLASLERHYGPLGDPRVIPNGRDASRFPPGPKEPLVLAAGRVWDPAKNAGAVARVASRVPWPVVIAGDAVEPGKADGASDTGSGTAARFLGRVPQPELAAWLARAAIFAHPARYEPFGLAVLEAALAGCALVLGDVPSLRERWDGAALFVDPADDDAIAAAIGALAADAALRSRLAAEARPRALALGPDRMAAAYLDLYGALVARRARRLAVAAGEREHA
jgi:glycosyltransferase involved in cell wall biosynthesis